MSPKVCGGVGWQLRWIDRSFGRQSRVAWRCRGDGGVGIGAVPRPQSHAMNIAFEKYLLWKVRL